MLRPILFAFSSNKNVDFITILAVEMKRNWLWVSTKSHLVSSSTEKLMLHFTLILSFDEGPTVFQPVSLYGHLNKLNDNGSQSQKSFRIDIFTLLLRFFFFMRHQSVRIVENRRALERYFSVEKKIWLTIYRCTAVKKWKTPLGPVNR